MQTEQRSLPPSIHEFITSIMPTMEGWCSPEKASALATHTLNIRPRVCVEIGVYSGRSLLAIALALKANSFGHIIGIDPWSPAASIDGFANDPPNRDWWARLDHNAIYKQCQHYIATLAVKDHTSLWTLTSDQAIHPLRHIAKHYHSSLPFVDILHIDGNHSVAQALADVNNYVPLVRPNALVALDDLDWETTKPAQRRLLDLCTELPPIGTCGFYRRKSDTIDTAHS